jgi:predicted ferric reductase
MTFAIAAAVVAGAVAGLACVGDWSVALAATLRGPTPTGFWLLSRASGVAAYVALWLSMIAGLAVTNRWTRAWPGARRAIDVHRDTALVALGLALLHALVLVGDRWAGFTLAGVLLPFDAPVDDWAAVAVGQLALYILAAIVVSFWLRRAVGVRLWRAIHYATFALFAAATVHGVAAGSDRAAGLYWTAAATVLFLATHRALRSAFPPRAAARAG